MSRIAIIHFTGPPAPGGVEQMVAAQATALTALGHRVSVVVGAGEELIDTDFFLIPRLLPSAVRDADSAPECLISRLRSIISHCDQCWVHNAFTVNLNTMLTDALLRLVTELPRVRWIAWCEDISADSRYLSTARRPVKPPLKVMWVTISETRRQELARHLGVEPLSISVVPPPADAARLLRLGPTGRRLLLETFAPRAFPVVLVPAKLLPHKRVELAIDVAVALTTWESNPLLLITGASSRHEPERSAALASALRQARADKGISKHFRFLADIAGGTPSDAAVRDCMAIADVVFIPSAEEGFGIPLLESAFFRAPVVCRDLPVFRELAADAAQYFGAEDSPERIACMLLAASRRPENILRRRALDSSRIFAQQVGRIASEPCARSINRTCTQR